MHDLKQYEFTKTFDRYSDEYYLCSAVDNLLATKLPTWVSISDRLPPKSGLYEVFSPHPRVKDTNGRMFAYYNPEWDIPWDGNNHPNDIATHWLDNIPEAPNWPPS